MPRVYRCPIAPLCWPRGAQLKRAYLATTAAPIRVLHSTTKWDIRRRFDAPASLHGELARVRGAGRGARNDTLNRAAVRLGRHFSTGVGGPLIDWP